MKHSIVAIGCFIMFMGNSEGNAYEMEAAMWSVFRKERI